MILTYTLIPSAPVGAFATQVFDHAVAGILSLRNSQSPWMLTIQVDDMDGYTIASSTEMVDAFQGDRLDVIELLTAMEHRVEVRARINAAKEVSHA